MLGAIVIVSGPTGSGKSTGKKLTTILGHEGTTIDPIGAPSSPWSCSRP